MPRPAETSHDLRLSFSTDVALRRRFMMVDEPLAGNIRFDLLLEVLDKLAEDTALAYARRSDPEARVVTAAIDNILLREPADVTRDLLLRARINYVGRTSLEVGIRIEHPDGNPIHLASCYFTMVARAGDGDMSRSIAVLPLDCADELEEERQRKAVARRESYRQQQAAATEPPDREEYALLAALHAAQDHRGFSGRLVSQLVTSNWEKMYPEQENVPQKIFGGYLIRRAFELASINAEEIAPERPVILKVNRINFLQPVRLGDKLHFVSRVVFTGRTSICVEVNIERISRDRVTRALSNSCVFTFVNVDGDMIPRPVPGVYPTTYAEDARYLEAYRRNRRHSERQTEPSASDRPGGARAGVEGEEAIGDPAD
ncbi:MAG: hotdog domain-containing protein [Acidobacteriota bacterium]